MTPQHESTCAALSGSARCLTRAARADALSLDTSQDASRHLEASAPLAPSDAPLATPDAAAHVHAVPPVRTSKAAALGESTEGGSSDCAVELRNFPDLPQRIAWPQEDTGLDSLPERVAWPEEDTGHSSLPERVAWPGPSGAAALQSPRGLPQRIDWPGTESTGGSPGAVDLPQRVEWPGVDSAVNVFHVPDLPQRIDWPSAHRAAAGSPQRTDWSGSENAVGLPGLPSLPNLADWPGAALSPLRAGTRSFRGRCDLLSARSASTSQSIAMTCHQNRAFTGPPSAAPSAHLYAAAQPAADHRHGHPTGSTPHDPGPYHRANALLRDKLPHYTVAVATHTAWAHIVLTVLAAAAFAAYLGVRLWYLTSGRTAALGRQDTSVAYSWVVWAAELALGFLGFYGHQTYWKQTTRHTALSGAAVAALREVLVRLICTMCARPRLRCAPANAKLAQNIL